MLRQAIVTTVDYCTRYAAQTIGIAVLLGLVTGIYAAGHFAIDADVNKLISKELPWRQREVAFEKSFPPKEETILAIIDAPTSELATQATTALIQNWPLRRITSTRFWKRAEGRSSQRTGCCSCPPRRSSASPRNSAKRSP